MTELQSFEYLYLFVFFHFDPLSVPDFNSFIFLLAGGNQPLLPGRGGSLSLHRLLNNQSDYLLLFKVSPDTNTH